MRGLNLNGIQAEEKLDARKYQYISLPSQCGTIDDLYMGQLEEAAMCCHLRDFKAALRIFKTLPPDIRHHPAVVFEESQVNWLDWSLYESEEVIRAGIAWGKEHAPKFADAGIYSLLRMALGRVRAMTHGNLIEGREGLREIRHWLREVPVEKYTDVQVRHPLLFHFALIIY